MHNTNIVLKAGYKKVIISLDLIRLNTYIQPLIVPDIQTHLGQPAQNMRKNIFVEFSKNLLDPP